VRITRLILSNFRNYAAQQCVFNSGRALFTGKNGQGKTNLLEAIYLCFALKSFRTSDFRRLIMDGSAACSVSAEIEYGGLPHTLSIQRSRTEYTCMLDGKNLKNKKSYIRMGMPVVLSNADILISTGPPALRREFFDFTLSLISEKYYSALMSYKKQMKQRNAELKAGRSPLHWNGGLARSGTILINARLSFLRALKPFLREAHSRLQGTDTPEADIVYTIFPPRGCAELNIISKVKKRAEQISEQEYLDLLEKSKLADSIIKTTGFGAHRDDFSFFLDTKNIIHYASQGQCRIFIYAVKLAVSSFLEKSLKKQSVLIVDDIFADLDEEKIKNFFSFTGDHSQMFLACANGQLLPKGLAGFTEYRISGGIIQESTYA